MMGFAVLSVKSLWFKCAHLGFHGSMLHTGDVLWEILVMQEPMPAVGQHVPQVVAQEAATTQTVAAPLEPEASGKPCTEEYMLMMPGSHMPCDPETLLGPHDAVAEPQQPMAGAQTSVEVRVRSPRLTRPRVFGRGLWDCRVQTTYDVPWAFGMRRHLPVQDILASCKERIQSIVDANDQNFKVGLCTDGLTRLHGYEREGARTLVIVHMSMTVEDAVHLERGCIGHFMSHPRCRNKGPGGEGMNCGVTPVFLYVALGGDKVDSRGDSTWERFMALRFVGPKSSA